MSKADIGLIGLAVMGQNLALNMNDKGFQVAVYNRTESKVDDFLAGPASGSNIRGAHHLEEFLTRLSRPRKVLLMVKAGTAVDALIEQMLPHLEAVAHKLDSHIKILKTNYTLVKKTIYRDLALTYDIRIAKLPSLLVFKDGKLQEINTKVMNKKQLYTYFMQFLDDVK